MSGYTAAELIRTLSAMKPDTVIRNFHDAELEVVGENGWLKFAGDGATSNTAAATIQTKLRLDTTEFDVALHTAIARAQRELARALRNGIHANTVDLNGHDTPITTTTPFKLGNES